MGVALGAKVDEAVGLGVEVEVWISARAVELACSWVATSMGVEVSEAGEVLVEMYGVVGSGILVSPACRVACT